MIESADWDAIPPEARAANSTLKVFGPDPGPGGSREVWSGWAASAVETPSGSLSIRRVFVIDGNPVSAEAVLFRAGTWDRVEYGGTTFDREELAANLAQKAEAQAANRAMIENQRRQAEAERLNERGIAVPMPMPGGAAGPLGMMPSRAGRRHPG